MHRDRTVSLPGWRCARPYTLTVTLALVLGIVTPPCRADAQVTASPDYIVGRILLPGANTGGVAYAGPDVFVGQGTFGAGTQRVARIAPDGTATTVVTGLNSIGGMTFDAAGDRLLFTDNARELPGTTTGDTLYALPAPGSVALAAAAATLELAAAGSIAAAANLLVLPEGTILVSNPLGNDAGRVVQVMGGAPSDLITGLDYVSGLALAGANELLVGEVDAMTFEGRVRRFDLDGNPLGPLASGLSGAIDAALDADGHLIVSGGFTSDFSSSTLVRIAPSGDVAEIASGFGFTSALAIDGPSGQIATLDFGVKAIDTLTPVTRLTPGGRAKKDCHAEWWGGVADLDDHGRPQPRWTCEDGAPCDRDGSADGNCTFLVGACFAIADPRLPLCQPVAIDGATVTSKRAPAAAANVQGAVEAVLPASAPACSRAAVVAVPVGRKPTGLVLKTDVGGKRGDRDRLMLRCRAAGA